MSSKNYLKDLILLRNDPTKLPVIRYAAKQGDVDAQYALGLIYAEGRGTEIDLARAHFWLSRAIEQGDKEAETLRNIVGSQMSDSEYSEAVRLRDGPKLELVAGS